MCRENEILIRTWHYTIDNSMYKDAHQQHYFLIFFFLILKPFQKYTGNTNTVAYVHKFYVTFFYCLNNKSRRISYFEIVKYFKNIFLVV